MTSLHLYDAHYICLNSINENTLERLAKILRVCKKCVWVDGIKQKDTLCNVIHIFSYSSIIYWLCQDRITPPPPKLIQGFWEDPWHRVYWEIEKVQVCLSQWFWIIEPAQICLFFFFFLQLSPSFRSQCCHNRYGSSTRTETALLTGCLKSVSKMCFC